MVSADRDAAASRVESEPIATNVQPCSRRCAAAAPSLTSSPQALPCRLPAASTVSSASTKAGAVVSPGTPRSWLRSRGPMNSTSTPSMAAISSTAATAAADSICAMHEDLLVGPVQRAGIEPEPAGPVVGGHPAVPARREPQMWVSASADLQRHCPCGAT